MHAGIHPPCGPGDPFGCGPGDPPGCGPGEPLYVGLKDPPWVWARRPPGQTPQPPHGCGSGDHPGDLQGMLGYHLQGVLGYHPPWTEFLKHASVNITLPQTSFAGGNKSISIFQFFTRLPSARNMSS